MRYVSLHVKLPIPCDTCVYHRVINEYGEVGCSASKNSQTCPKLKRFAEIQRNIVKHDLKGHFDGYKRKVFGEPAITK